MLEESGQLAFHDRFHEVLLGCLNKSFDALGDSVKRTIMFYFEKDYGLNPNSIPLNPDALMQALRGIFGIGAMTFEQSIVKDLYDELGLGPVVEENFAEALKAARYLYKHKDAAANTTRMPI